MPKQVDHRQATRAQAFNIFSDAPMPSSRQAVAAGGSDLEPQRDGSGKGPVIECSNDRSLAAGLAAMSRMPDARDAARAASHGAPHAGPDEISDAEARRRQQAARVAGHEGRARTQATSAARSHLLPAGTRQSRLPAPAPSAAVAATPLPAMINRAVTATAHDKGDIMRVMPRWTAVARLPGYLQQGIRTIGRDLFRGFPDFQAVPLEDIQVLAHYGTADGRSAGPNTRAEIEALTNWIVRNGVRDDTATLDFGQTFGRGYAPDIQVWNVPGASFMLVRERARHGHVQVDGMCVYAAPGGRGTQLRQEGRPDRERLSHDRFLGAEGECAQRRHGPDSAVSRRLRTDGSGGPAAVRAADGSGGPAAVRAADVAYFPPENGPDVIEANEEEIDGDGYDQVVPPSPF